MNLVKTKLLNELTQNEQIMKSIAFEIYGYETDGYFKKQVIHEYEKTIIWLMKELDDLDMEETGK